MKKSFEAAVATFANPCPAAVSRLRVILDTEVSLEGDRNFAAASPGKTAIYSKKSLLMHTQVSFSFHFNFRAFRPSPTCGLSLSSVGRTPCTPAWLLFITPGLSGGCLRCFCLLRWALCCVGSDSLLTSNSSSPPPLSCQLAASSPLTYSTSP